MSDEPFGFFDATCECGARLGWLGTLADRPPCEECGRPAPTLPTDLQERMRLDRLRAEALAEEDEGEAVP